MDCHSILYSVLICYLCIRLSIGEGQFLRSKWVVVLLRAPPRLHNCRIAKSLLVGAPSFTRTDRTVERALRLRGGGTALEGQVEVYLQGSWGVIRDDDWTLEDASVACRQMGFAAAADALQTGYAGVWPPSARVVMNSVVCTGKENSLLACRFENVSRLLGDTETIASVVCAGKLFSVLCDKSKTHGAFVHSLELFRTSKNAYIVQQIVVGIFLFSLLWGC